MEWEPGEGYHEEEWYDPGDWFNDDGKTDYEYDYPYFSSDYWEDDGYYPGYWSYDPWYWDESPWYDTYDYDTSQNSSTNNASARNQSTNSRSANNRSQNNQSKNTDNYSWDADEQEWQSDSDRQQSAQAQRSQRNTRQQQNAENGQVSYIIVGYLSDQENSRNAQTQQGQRSSASQTSNINGTIDGFRHVNVANGGKAEERTVVKLKMQDGRNAIVDLGRRIDLQDLNLEKGSEIRVQGRAGMVGERNALIADSIRVGDEQFTIDRKARNYNLAGTIEDYRTASLGDKREDHLLVRIELEEGQERIVDFGPNATLEDLNLKKGDSVRVKGRSATVNDKSIIVASYISVDGEQQELDRRSQARVQ